MDFYLRNQTSDKFRPAFFRRILSIIDHHEEGLKDFLEIGLILVDNKTIRRINRRYRKLDQVTDVLSFVFDSAGVLRPSPDPKDNLPVIEIYLSLEQATRQAKQQRHSFQRELATLFVHGVLHGLGYRDQTPGERKRMLARQQEIMSELNLN